METKGEKMMREFKTYEEMEKVHQEDVNAFPIVYLFGKKTEEEIRASLSKIGAKTLKDCVGVWGGGIIMKKEYSRYLNMFRQHQRERDHFFASSEERMVQAILAEMYNHEYGYTHCPEDTLYALGKSDLSDKKFAAAWKKAERICFKKTEKCCFGK